MDNQNLQTGLTTQEALARQKIYGKNQLVPTSKNNLLIKLLFTVLEPMFLILLIAATIYFILGEPLDGTMMLLFVTMMMIIEGVQKWKTDKTLKALKDLSAPKITVIRDNIEQCINSIDLVPGDIMLIEEGVKIPADGTIIECHDLSVDESTLTGESFAIIKSANSAEEGQSYWRKDYCYAGTVVTQGFAQVVVEKIGSETEYGKIGRNIAAIKKTRNPLNKQVDRLVRICMIIALFLFLTVAIIVYLNIRGEENSFISSVLAGITLAMAMIPEEFPVVLTVFLSMGAWRLAQKKALVKNSSAIETLGAISILCVDKTGTLTVNQMEVSELYCIEKTTTEVASIMALACEKNPYDPMEKALLNYSYANGVIETEIAEADLIDEYAFTNETKMMGHIYQMEKEIVVAAKGSFESIFEICDLSTDIRAKYERKANEMAQSGLRVIAIASGEYKHKDDIPEELSDCHLTLLGLVALQDPPRENIKQEIKACYRAGIRVIMITGDNGLTAQAIAEKVGMKNYQQIIDGRALANMSEEELKEKVATTNIFARTLPEQKMKIVKALKDNGAIVAMTGDGVNDAAALKLADIGITMGKRGNDVSKEAADLVLTDDNFSTIVETVKDGRRIYDNIRKAIGYIFAIHIPIALASIMAPLLKIAPTSMLLLPIHILLLELIIDPTCSIVLERQAAESDIMDRAPRKINEGLLNRRTLITSLIYGLVIFAGSFGIYYHMQKTHDDLLLARTMGIVTIVISNIFLVFASASRQDFIISSLGRLIKDKVIATILIITIIILALIVYSPLNDLFKFVPLNIWQILICFGLASLTFWYEIVKVIKRIKKKSS